MNKNRYPKLVVDLKKLQHNIDRVLVNCQDQGVEVAGAAAFRSVLSSWHRRVAGLLLHLGWIRLKR